MPVHTFQTFDAAWHEFIQTDHLSLDKATLNLKQIDQLHEYVKSCPDSVSIYLSDVRLLPQHATNKNEIISLEQALINLLCHELWQVIRLNKIEVIENLTLSEDFYHRFLCFSYYQDLNKLNLSLPYTGLESYFLQFFKKNPRLKSLRLDLNYEPPAGFIKELTELITDSKLEKLYFGNTPLDLDAYNALDLLLDNNYYLQVKIPEADHEDEELRDTYTQLARRATKKGYERFKEEQLTQNKLLTIAEYVLRQRGLTGLLSLSNDEDDLPMMTKIVRFGSLSEYIPQIYKKHSIYINQNYKTLLLDWMMPLEFDPQKTTAHHLINVAIEKKDGQSIITILEEVKKQDEAGFAILLNAGNENNVLDIFSKFDGKKHKPSPWLKPVLNYIEKNIDYLIPRFGDLSRHKDLYTLLQEFRDHLIHYLETMNARSGWSEFFKCITGIASHLKERKKEWDFAFKALIKAVEAGTNPEQPLVSERIRELRQYILPLAYNAYHAKKGWKNVSELHDENFRLVREVDKVADDLRIRLAIEEDSEKKAMQEKISDLEAALKEKDEKLKIKDEIIESQGAYIQSLENDATPGCSKNIFSINPSSTDERDLELEQGVLQKKIRPGFIGIFASVKPPSESSLDSPGSYSALSISSWGSRGSYGD
jgi:hypothetical protein